MVLWIGFALALACLLVLARRSLAVGMATAALILGAFTLSPAGLGRVLWSTISDPSVLLLALVVAVIPLIGGAMEVSGQMGRLVDNLRIGVRPFLAVAPGLLGMLPMPGGALLSAPLVERGAGHVAGDVKAAANVWFRHVLLLVYPLGSALIASAKVAGLDVYATIPYLAPAFTLSVLLGAFFLLRRAGGRLAQGGAFSVDGLLVPLGILLAAPAVDLAVSTGLRLPYREIATSAGVALSLGLALAVGRVGPRRWGRVTREAKPWKYAAIIFAMFAFLNVFTASGAPERMAEMAMPPVVLCVVVGFVLGLVTGRIEAPVAVILPIYATTHPQISLPAFAVTYYAVFLGYVLTPIHPCVSVSVEYFGTSMGPFLRRLALPTAIGVAATLVVGLLVL